MRNNGNTPYTSGLDGRSLGFRSVITAQSARENNLQLQNMAQTKLTPLSDVVDEVWGKEGTPKRDAMEAKLKAEVNSYYLGEAIRNTRLAQKLTQEELGGRIGVQRAQISRLEKGRTPISLQTMSRVFQALGVSSATLGLGVAGKVALW